MDYTSLTPVVIKAENEQKLQVKLSELKQVTNKMPNIISIYPRGSFVYAWVFIDERQISAAPKEELPKKKSTKKKKIKKA